MNGMLFDVNDPAIIAVGYRVNSVCATQFRQWATSVPVINISPRQKAASWPVQSSLQEPAPQRRRHVLGYVALRRMTGKILNEIWIFLKIMNQ